MKFFCSAALRKSSAVSISAVSLYPPIIPATAEIRIVRILMIHITTVPNVGSDIISNATDADIHTPINAVNKYCTVLKFSYLAVFITSAGETLLSVFILAVK